MNPVGVFIAFVSGVLLAAFQIAHREAHVRETPVSDGLLVISALGVTALVVTAQWARTVDSVLGIGPRELVYATLFFAVGGVLNFTVAFRSLKRSQQLIGTSRTASLIATTPFFSGLFALVFLREVLTLRVLTGMIVVVFGAYLVATE